MAKLYELSESYRQLLNYVEDEEVDLEMFKDTLESIEDLMGDKMENIAKLIKNTNGDIEVFKQEENRLYNRRRSMENKVEYLKKYLLESLETTGLKSVKAGTFTVRKQKNPDNISISENAKIPEEFLTPQEPKIEMKALKEAVLKNGLKIDGVSKAPESYHVRIQ